MFLLAEVSNVWYVLLGLVMLLVAVFLIMLVLVQRGRGGGLTGALGGMGGQSAFGTKAGDTFTRITYVTAIIWILTCMLSIKLLHREVLAGQPSKPIVIDLNKKSGGTTKDTGSGDEKTTTPSKSGSETDEKPPAKSGDKAEAETKE
jgi:preprotein translocase subunit SecG